MMCVLVQACRNNMRTTMLVLIAQALKATE